MTDDLIFKYGNREDLPDSITPGAIYFTKNKKTGQGEIFYDTPIIDGTEESQRFSVIGGGIYVGSEEFPDNYNIKIDPKGISTGEAYKDDNGVYYPGIMSAEDKRKLDQLWTYFGNLKIDITDIPPSNNKIAEVNTLTFVIPSV